jgi:hypothetical protein
VAVQSALLHFVVAVYGAVFGAVAVRPDVVALELGGRVAGDEGAGGAVGRRVWVIVLAVVRAVVVGESDTLRDAAVVFRCAIARARAREV